MKKTKIVAGILILAVIATASFAAFGTGLLKYGIKYADLFSQGSFSKFAAPAEQGGALNPDTPRIEALDGSSVIERSSPGNKQYPTALLQSKKKKASSSSSSSILSSSSSSSALSSSSSSSYSSSVISSSQAISSSFLSSAISSSLVISSSSAISSSVQSSSQASSSSVSSSTSISSSSASASIPQSPAGKIVLGFATKYSTTDTSSYKSIQNNLSVLDEVATFTYTADQYGNITGTIPKDQLDLAKANGIKTYLLVHNFIEGGFSRTAVKALLQSPSARQTLIGNLMTAMKNNGYSGVNVDFENIDYNDRPYYSLLIKEMKEAYAPAGLKVTVSIPAKTYDYPTDGWSGAFDYKAIGYYADEVLLMTYDEHGTWGSAGAVASINWVTNVIKYAVTVIPKEKILMGLAAYGYEWASDGNRAVSLNQVDSLIATYGGSVVFDSVTKSPYYKYTAGGITHTIWFENAQSISYKLDVVNAYDIRGVGVWRLGLENSGYFNTIKNKIG